MTELVIEQRISRTVCSKFLSMGVNRVFRESGTILQKKELNGSVYRICVIEEGLSNNFNLYRKEVLKRALPLFERLTVRRYVFSPKKPGDRFHLDHVPEQLVNSLGVLTGNNVGFLRNVAFEEVYSFRQRKMVWAITADFVVTNEEFRAELFRTYQEGGIDLEGRGRSVYEFSIECAGPDQIINWGGRRVREVIEIKIAKELTAVSDGAAGGRIMRITASNTEEVPMEDEVPGNEESSKEVIEDSASDETSEETLSEATPAGAEHDEMCKREAEETLTESTPNVPEVVISESSPTEKGGEVIQEAVKVLQESQPDVERLMESRLRKALIQAVKEAGHKDNLEESTTPAVKKLLKELGYDLKNGQLVPASKDEEIVENTAEEITDTPGKSDLQKAILLARGGDISGCIELLEALYNGQNTEKIRESEKDSNNSAESSVSKTASVTETDSVTVNNRRMESQNMDGLKTAVESSASDTVTLEKSQLEGFMSHLALRESNTEKKLAEVESKLAESENRHRLAESSSVLKATLQSCGLPKAAQAEIESQFNGKIFDPEELNRMVESTRRICSSMIGTVDNGGTPARAGSTVQIGRCGIDWAKAEADRLFGYNWRADQDRLSESQKDTYRNLPTIASLRQWFCNWYGDPDCGLGQGYIGPNAILREATSADLPQLLGDSAYRALMQAYLGQKPVWRNICDVLPVPNFKTQRRIRLGGLGILPVVTESDSANTYLQLGIGGDEERTYAVTTKGGLVKLTRTMIINDDIQGLQAIPREIGESAMLTLQANVLACLIANAGGSGINSDTSYDGGLIYSTAHENLTNSPVGYQSLVDMMERLGEMRRFANVGTLTNNLNSSDTSFDVSAKLAAALKASTPISDTIRIDGEYMKFVSASGVTITVVRGTNGSTAASHTAGARVEQQGAPISMDNVNIVHPTQLKAEVFSLLASALMPESGINAASALFPEFSSGAMKPMPVHSLYLGEDRNNYYMVAGRPIEVGFLGGRENPDLLLQDNPLVGDVFTGDCITWKTRHEYGCVLLDHKFVQAGIVA